MGDTPRHDVTGPRSATPSAPGPQWHTRRPHPRTPRPGRSGTRAGRTPEPPAPARARGHDVAPPGATPPGSARADTPQPRGHGTPPADHERLRPAELPCAETLLRHTRARAPRARGTPTARAHRRHTGRGGAQPSCVRARHLPRGRTGSGAGAGARPVVPHRCPARRSRATRPRARPRVPPHGRQRAPRLARSTLPASGTPPARPGPGMEHTRDSGPTTPGTPMAGAAELPAAHVMPVPASSRSEPGLQPRSGHPSPGAGGRASWHRNPARYRGSRPGAGPFPGGAGGVAAALVVPAARSLRSWQRRGRTDAGCPVDRTPGCPVDRTTPAGEAARCALAPGPATAHPESPS